MSKMKLADKMAKITKQALDKIAKDKHARITENAKTYVHEMKIRIEEIAMSGGEEYYPSVDHNDISIDYLIQYLTKEGFNIRIETDNCRAIDTRLNISWCNNVNLV